MLNVGFITLVDKATWLSPIVIMPKKNKKLRVCVNYCKLNDVTVPNPFPIPYTNSLLDDVARHKMYSFFDGFLGYNQIKMAPKDWHKIAFITKWGVFISKVMTFGLQSAQATF